METAFYLNGNGLPSLSGESSVEGESLLVARRRREFEWKRDKLLDNIPIYCREAIQKIGFVHWDKYRLPVLVVNPFDLPPRPYRAAWLEMLTKSKKQNSPEQTGLLVYWYGDRDPETCYSLIKCTRFLSYEEAKRRGEHKLPEHIREKMTAKKPLSDADQDLVRAFWEMQLDLKVAPCDRKPGVLLAFDEDYGMLNRVARQLDFNKVGKENGRTEKSLRDDDKNGGKKNEVHENEDCAEASFPLLRWDDEKHNALKSRQGTDVTEPEDDMFQNTNSSGSGPIGETKPKILSPNHMRSDWDAMTFETLTLCYSADSSNRVDSTFESNNGLADLKPMTAPSCLLESEHLPDDSDEEDVYLSEESESCDESELSSSLAATESSASCENLEVGCESRESSASHQKLEAGGERRESSASYQNLEAGCESRTLKKSPRKLLLDHVKGIVESVVDEFVEEMLARIPIDYRKMFNQIGFVMSDDRRVPVLIVSPFDVLPRSIRAQWFSCFMKPKKEGNTIAATTWIVFRYGSSYHQSFYSTIQPVQFTSYENAKRQGKHKLPKSVQSKVEHKQALTNGEEELIRAFQEMEEDLAKDPSRRRRSLVVSRDDHQALSIYDVSMLEATLGEEKSKA